MENRKIFLIIMILLSILLIAFPIPAKKGKRHKVRRWYPKGYLVIKCNVKGAQVFIDGKLRGQTPLKKIRLRIGEHTLKISKQGYTDFIDVVQILRRKVTKVEAILLPVSSYLKLKGNVKGARVFIDDIYIGKLPVDYEVKPGKHTIVVKKLGYYDYKKVINTKPGESKEIVINLKAMPMDERNPLYHPPPPPPKWYEKWWVWTAIGGGVAALVGIIAGSVIATSGGGGFKVCGNEVSGMVVEQCK